MCRTVTENNTEFHFRSQHSQKEGVVCLRVENRRLGGVLSRRSPVAPGRSSGVKSRTTRQSNVNVTELVM